MERWSKRKISGEKEQCTLIDVWTFLNQEFMTSPIDIKLKMHCLYSSNFTGSSLWDFLSDYFNMLCNSWNVNVRIMLDLPSPRDTHCYIVLELDSGPHVRQMLFSRYIKFLNNIYNGRR